jgi:HAD superfamily hydrolase (TIGR01509 family)
MSASIQALIFDFDGLIVDTETPEFNAWHSIFTAHGCELPLATWALNIGTHGAIDIYEVLAQATGQPVDRTAIRQAVRAHYATNTNGQTLLPGVRAYLDAAHQAGIRLAIASSSKHEWVDKHLAEQGIFDYFHAVVCANDVEEVKPHPALYLLALERLGVPASAAVAFEDSPNGILAAKAAGIYCIAVPNSITCNLPLDQADLHLTSLASLPLAELLARFEP